MGRAGGGPKTGPAADRCRARKRNWDAVLERVAAGPGSSQGKIRLHFNPEAVVAAAGVWALAPEAVVVDRRRLPRSRSVALASLGQPLPRARGSDGGDEIICAHLEAVKAVDHPSRPG